MTMPFFSGIVGYLGYDLSLDFEKIPLKSQDGLKIPDCFFGFYDCVITIDHLAHRLHVLSTGLGERNGYLAQKRAEYQVEKITKKLSQYSNDQRLTRDFRHSNERAEGLPLTCNFTKEAYFKAVREALKYIRQGDIYQVNLAQRFLFQGDRGYLNIDPAELYRHLRRLSPSCFGGYLNCGHFQILSASPEEFLRLSKRAVQTRPMKGTRARGVDSKEDRKLRGELLNSQKDKAELLMITDLERNDLGRVCQYGSINVKKMRTLEAYQTVFQTTSTVEGLLAKDKNCFDLLRACFPSGSVTGCPKIRAMAIIEELEPHRRTFYTGSLGYIDFSGNMDFNVLIRSLLLHDDKICFYVGSGIVADSDAQSEYCETLIKAKAIRQAIGRSISKNTVISYG